LFQLRVIIGVVFNSRKASAKWPLIVFSLTATLALVERVCMYLRGAFIQQCTKNRVLLTLKRYLDPAAAIVPPCILSVMACKLRNILPPFMGCCMLLLPRKGGRRRRRG
jgi:hypothetical protein